MRSEMFLLLFVDAKGRICEYLEKKKPLRSPNRVIATQKICTESDIGGSAFVDK